MKKVLYSIWEIAEVFIIALVAVAIIKYFLIQPFIVNGASMEPTFFNGNYLLVDEISYRLSEPQRGDVIVFLRASEPQHYYIKRVIGLPGERVEIDGNTIHIYSPSHPQGFVLDEPYLPKEIKDNWSAQVTTPLQQGEYFVLGDNRLNSYDSRFWGAVQRDSIVGLARVRLWPPSQIAVFSTPSYATNGASLTK